MKIYAYNIPRYTHEVLKKEHPTVEFIPNTDRLLHEIKKEDVFICMWDDKETLNRLNELNNKVFPSKEIIDFSSNREKMSKFVDEHSMFAMEREYVKCDGMFQVTVPKLNRSLNVVVKVGEEHRGQNKFLKYPGQQMTVKDSVIFEEFLDNAHSFRVLLIEEDVFIIEYFDDPNNPKSMEQRWIKNLNPLLEENENHALFKDAIEDTLKMADLLDYRYIGVDYVRNDEKTLCLEINTFPGVRLNERTREAGLHYWRKKINELSE